MGKKLSTVTIEEPNALAETTPEVRSEVLAELGGTQKAQVLENLVESAMILGLTDNLAIRTWLGVKGISNINAIENAKKRILERWMDETSNVIEYAKTQRATQIKKAWEEVRNCEDMFVQSENTKDKVAIKKLQLEWMQYISKLSFVDKMTEAQNADMQIIVNGNVGIEDGN